MRIPSVLPDQRIGKNQDLPAYAWPGGYPIFYLADDEDALCPECVNSSRNPIHDDPPNDGWRIIGYDINWEDSGLYCAHCGKRIESAYAEDKFNEEVKQCNPARIILL